MSEARMLIEQNFAEIDQMIKDMQNGIPLNRNPKIERLAKLAVESMKNDIRTEDEIIADGVAFIMNDNNISDDALRAMIDALRDISKDKLL